MAVEVPDNQVFPNLGREGHADGAMVGHLQSMQSLVSLLAHKHQPHRQRLMHQLDCVVPAVADAATISGFKKLVAVLGGLGHARFRRAPASASTSASASASASAFASASDSTDFRGQDVYGKIMPSSSLHQIPAQTNRCGPSQDEFVAANCFHTAIGDGASRATTDTQNLHGSRACRPSASPSCNEGRGSGCASAEQDHEEFVPSSSSFLSSISDVEGGAGGTVSKGKAVISSGRPPLPPQKRKGAPQKIEEGSTKSHRSAQCHCAKHRKEKTRRVLRISSIGLKGAEIPADGYSWSAYGEKLSRDSLQPRVYYKCSNVRGCPARKHIERASDNPDMLVVTYGREHLHPQIHKVVMAASE